MEISRDTTAGAVGMTSIHLRYSRQFQSNGHTHTIDAEATVAVGTSPEKREQILREVEASVEQLAYQITQRGTRPAGEAYSPAPARSNTTPSRATEPPASQPVLPRPASFAAQPTAPLPVSESMPTSPTASGSRPINLPYFLDYVKKRWSMSGQEAMELLEVHELTGLNLREALFKLRDIKEPPGAQSSNATPARTSPPVVEAPRQTNRSAPTAPNSRPTASQAAPNTAPVTHAPGTPTFRQESQSISQATSITPSAFAIAQEPKQPTPTRDGLPDFAGSAKAPLPIQLGVVRDLAPRSSYAFAEEDEDEEDYELPAANEAGDVHRQGAEKKLDELKNLRNGNAASPERLIALKNVIGEQISEEQLEQIVKEISGSTNRKKLKIQQVEELISWAKEDYFAEEVSAILEPFDEEEE